MNPPPPSGAIGASDADTALCGEVLDAAHRAAAERIRLAEHQAADLLATARSEAGREVEAHLAGMAREANRRCAAIRASIPMEIRRREAARREAELESIRNEALGRLHRRDAGERRADLLAVIPPALAAMEGSSFVLRLSAADQSLADEAFLAELARAPGLRSVRLASRFDPAVPPGGVVVESGDGGRRWDNTAAARCARLWPELRLRVAAAAGWLTREGSP